MDCLAQCYELNLSDRGGLEKMRVGRNLMVSFHDVRTHGGGGPSHMCRRRPFVQFIGGQKFGIKYYSLCETAYINAHGCRNGLGNGTLNTS